jgi:hypothetical protein
MATSLKIKRWNDTIKSTSNGLFLQLRSLLAEFHQGGSLFAVDMGHCQV